MSPEENNGLDPNLNPDNSQAGNTPVTQADLDAQAEKLQLEREQLEADKAKLAEGKSDLEKEVEAFDKKKDEIEAYQERVRTTNKEFEHIDFHKTGIKNFAGNRKVGEPTATAPTKRKINGEVVDIPKDGE